MRFSKLKVGLLGGSFNPAHDGHLAISLLAINKYQFDYVIWLVANQNPLKQDYKYDIFTRCADALSIANHPKIIVSSAEYDLGVYYAYDSLKALINRFSEVSFTWLMGIDNLGNFHQWYQYQNIPALCPIIIFDRPVSNRLVNNSRFLLKLNPIVDKTMIMPIITDRSLMDYSSSTAIRRSKDYIND